MAELIIMEQFMNVCGKNLQVFLRERYPVSMEQLLEFAESYVTGHGGWCKNSRSAPELYEDASEKKVGTAPLEKVTNKLATGDKVKCYRCGKQGHKSIQCRQTQDKKPANVSVCQNSSSSSQAPQFEPTRNPDTCAHSEVLSCGHWVEVISAAVDMTVVRGKVCGAEADILRDTGCSTVVVRSELIPPEDIL